MKRLVIAMMALVIMTSTVFANTGDKLDDTSEAVTKALVTFKDDNNQATIDLFKAIKATPVNKGISIKIYLTDGTKQAYACHRHDVLDPYECHQSN